MARWRRKRYFRHERRCAVHDWITVRQTAQYWLNTIAGLGGEGGSAKNLGTGRANYRAGEARYDSPEVVSRGMPPKRSARRATNRRRKRRFSQPGTAARRAWEPNTEKTPPSASDQRPIRGGGVGRVRVSKMSGRGRCAGWARTASGAGNRWGGSRQFAYTPCELWSRVPSVAFPQ